jgi:hypothetical protein
MIHGNMQVLCKHTTIYIPICHPRAQHVPQESIIAHTFITKQAHCGFRSNMFLKIWSQPRVKVCYILINNKSLKTIWTTVPTKIKIRYIISMNNKWAQTDSNTTRTNHRFSQWKNHAICKQLSKLPLKYWYTGKRTHRVGTVVVHSWGNSLRSG